MRREFTELLRCPVCAAEGSFDVEIAREDSHEIVQGYISCRNCGERFTIREGYLDLLPEPSHEVQREQEGQRRIEQQTGELVWPDDPQEQRDFVLALPQGHPDSVEHAPVVRYALDRLGLEEGVSVLDLGSGFSWTTVAFARRNCRAVALDVYANALSGTRHFIENGDYFERCLADMMGLPFRGNAFDVVFANAAIHHTPDLALTSREIARVLKPGGRMIFVNEPVVGRFQRARKEAFGVVEKEDGINECIYTAAEWKRMLREAGLRPRLRITEAGIAEKIRRRRELPRYQSAPLRAALRLLEIRWLRKALLRLLNGPLLDLYPFNVVIWADKPA